MIGNSRRSIVPPFRVKVERPKAAKIPSAKAVLKVLLAAGDETDLDIANDARARIDVKTGAARRSIAVERATVEGNVVRGAVGAGGQGAPYARGLEFGTGVFSEDVGTSRQPVIIRPKKPGGVLAWPNAAMLGPAGGKFRRLSGQLRVGARNIPGAMVFARWVVQMGNQPHPFLGPAHSAKAPGLADRIKAGLARLFAEET